MARRKRTSRKKKGSGAAGALLAIFFLSVLVAAGAVAWLILSPFGPRSETFVEFGSPARPRRLCRQRLEEAGVVRSRYAFDLLRILKRGTLRAGEYRFDHPAPMTEVYARIARGDVFTKAVTVPEGANIFDIAARAANRPGLVPAEFLDAAVKQTGLVARSRPGREEPGRLSFSRHVPFFAQGHAGADRRQRWFGASGQRPRNWV